MRKLLWFGLGFVSCYYMAKNANLPDVKVLQLNKQQAVISVNGKTYTLNIGELMKVKDKVISYDGENINIGI